MTVRDRFTSVLGGAVAGILGGLFGVGGGAILVPILTGALGATQHQAHGTSLAAIGATAVAGIIVYGASGRVDWATAAVAGLASVLTARLGARAASKISQRQLKFAFAAFVAVVGARLLWSAAPGPALLGTGIPMRILVDLGTGALVGLLAGFMGVGGGVIAVPAFVLLLGMPQHVAQGTSLALILVTAPAGALEHARRGNVLGRLVPGLAIGAAAGGLLASVLVQRIPVLVLTRAFAVFLLALSAHTALQARRMALAGHSKGA